MTTGRKWTSALDPEKLGPQFHSFYVMRSHMESMAGAAAARVNRLEYLALDGQFEQCYREYIEFFEEYIPKSREQFVKQIKMAVPN